MNQQTFQIMYNALLEIASAKTFFDSEAVASHRASGEKKLAEIAKKALSDIVNQTHDDAGNSK